MLSIIKKSIQFAAILLTISAIAQCRVPTTPVNAATKPNNQTVERAFSPFIWTGKAPDGKTRIMLVVSKDANKDEFILTGYKLRDYGLNDPVKAFELSEGSFVAISGMQVYPDPKRHVIYAAINGGGGSTAGVWVVSLDASGAVKSLFVELNRGEPSFRMHNGNPEIREVWEIARLMQHKWRPDKQFNGHVLVERIYTMQSSGQFAITSTRPAIAQERKLKKNDFNRLLEDRKAVEQELAGK